MFTGWKRTVVLVAAALAVGLLGVGLTTAAKPKPPAPPVTYTMTLVPLDLYDGQGKFVGTASEMYAHAMNNLGEVVGLARRAAEGRWRGWLYSPGVTWDLEDLIHQKGWLEWRVGTRSLDINDAGQIVGMLYHPAQNLHALFRYTPDAQQLEVLQGVGDTASKLAINYWGDVVGTLTRPEVGEPGAFVWKAGEDSITWLLPEYAQTEALDINDWGQITGTIGDHLLGATGSRAFRYTPDEGLLVLNPLGRFSSYPYWEFTLGTAINNSGQVAGTTSVRKGYCAFRYTDGVGMVNLGALSSGRGGQTYSDARDINWAGQVVGYSPSEGHPFFWTEANGMLDLWSLIQKPLPEGAEDSTTGDIGVIHNGEALVIKDPADGKTFGPIAGTINARSGGTVEPRAFILWSSASRNRDSTCVRRASGISATISAR
jgi:probable HAF family extracellular repeat protein